MNYELAKELKGAGFPQENTLFYWSIPLPEKAENEDERRLLLGDKPELHSAGVNWGRLYEKVASPSLSDLIEDCGDEFGTLEAKRNGWWAFGIDEEKYAQANTPEEAVARLWLTLNS